MTREEALNILHNASVYHPDYLDALNMAIKALEQETVSKEVYDHEYFLRKELEIKIAKLKAKLEQQESILDKIKQIVDRPTGNNAEEKAYNYMMIVKDIREVLEDGKID